MQPALWTLRCQVDVYLAAPDLSVAAVSGRHVIREPRCRLPCADRHGRQQARCHSLGLPPSSSAVAVFTPLLGMRLVAVRLMDSSY